MTRIREEEELGYSDATANCDIELMGLKPAHTLTITTWICPLQQCHITVWPTKKQMIIKSMKTAEKFQ